MPRPTIAFASDHAGIDLRHALAEYVCDEGFSVVDLGPDSTDSVDYPDYAHRLCHAVENGEAHYGILLCGSGIGMSIAANRHAHIRAALVSETVSAALARQHNDANVLVLGARMIGVTQAKACVHTFLTTAFEGGRHQKRLDKLNKII